MFPCMFAFNSGMVSVTDKSLYLLKKLKVKKIYTIVFQLEGSFLVSRNKVHFVQPILSFLPLEQ